MATTAGTPVTTLAEGSCRVAFADHGAGTVGKETPELALQGFLDGDRMATPKSAAEWSLSGERDSAIEATAGRNTVQLLHSPAGGWLVGKSELCF